MAWHTLDLSGWNGYFYDFKTEKDIPVKLDYIPPSVAGNSSMGFSWKAEYEEDYIPERVIFLEKEGITIALWKDGTMTTAKASGGDKFQPEIGVAIVTMKKIYGSTTNFWNFVEEAKLSRKVKGLNNGFCA